jgi:hypothetical protein
MRRAAVSTIRVFSFMEHFQFNIKLVPAVYDTEQIAGDAFEYTERTSRVDELPRHEIFLFGWGWGYFTTLSVYSASCPFVR